MNEHLSEETVRAKLGDRADEKIEAAKRVLDAYGDERTKGRLSRTLLGNSAEIIEALYKVAEREESIREEHGADSNPFKGNSMDRAVNNQFRFRMQDLTLRACYDAEMDVIRRYGPLDLADITINSNGDNGKEE